MSTSPERSVPNASPAAQQAQFDRLATSRSFDGFWRHAGQRKWIYLIGGVLIGTLLILAIQRNWWSRSYVTPVVVPAYRAPVSGYRLNDGYMPDGRRVGDAVVDSPVVQFPTQVVTPDVNSRLPVYPSGPGGQVMPYTNTSGTDKVVKEAIFYQRNAGRPLIPGVGIPAYELRFGPADYDPSRRVWSRLVSDLTLPAAAQTRVVVHIVDPARAGQRIYGTLVLRCADGELIQYEASKVVLLPE
ncbi:hypothetical protein NA78x_000145 [Anatilimnocola sp. NA78]|uniref:hypothetical protein n=1 Tax=Anatilimnocola sp. NA78 TaxID=3415683 RepID=UPI003CE46EEF